MSSKRPKAPQPVTEFLQADVSHWVSRGLVQENHELQTALSDLQVDLMARTDECLAQKKMIELLEERIGVEVGKVKEKEKRLEVLGAELDRAKGRVARTEELEKKLEGTAATVRDRDMVIEHMHSTLEMEKKRREEEKAQVIEMAQQSWDWVGREMAVELARRLKEGRSRLDPDGPRPESSTPSSASTIPLSTENVESYPSLANTIFPLPSATLPKSTSSSREPFSTVYIELDPPFVRRQELGTEKRGESSSSVRAQSEQVEMEQEGAQNDQETEPEEEEVPVPRSRGNKINRRKSQTGRAVENSTDLPDASETRKRTRSAAETPTSSRKRAALNHPTTANSSPSAVRGKRSIQSSPSVTIGNNVRRPTTPGSSLGPSRQPVPASTPTPLPTRLSTQTTTPARPRPKTRNLPERLIQTPEEEDVKPSITSVSVEKRKNGRTLGVVSLGLPDDDELDPLAL